nr:PREDICTED: uncharacterized protein LOC105679526 [Linepithema humile]
MSQLRPAKKPFEITLIDTIGGFGGARSTKKYLHLLVDHFTRYAYIITSKTQDATNFIKLVKSTSEVDKINTILADQYPKINSKKFKKFLMDEGITLIFTAVDSPFSNGLNERLNQTLVNKIRCAINENQKKRAWTTIAQQCVQKYNETKHTVTGFAPKYLLDGTDTTTLPMELKQNVTEHHWIQDRETALKNTIKSHEYNKKLFNEDRLHYKFEVGDMVYVGNGNKLNRKNLDELKTGLYKIAEKISKSIYRIDTGHNKEESNLFHITKIFPAEAINYEENTAYSTSIIEECSYSSREY